MCDEINDVNYDEQLFNQCAEIEAKLSQPANDEKIVVDLTENTDTSSTVIVEELEDAKRKEFDRLHPVEGATKDHKILRQRKLRLRNAALRVRNLRRELRWYQLELLREMDHHAKEMQRIRMESNRIDMERNRYRILSNLVDSLTRLLPTMECIWANNTSK